MKVGIVNSNECAKLACTSPKFTDRYALIIGLIHSYGLFRNLLQIPPLSFTSKAEVYKALAAFHSTDYIDALYQLQSWYATDPEPCLSQEEEDLLDSYGLSYDCPGFPHVFDYALAAVRCSLAAAMALTRGDCHVALNWAGGWHHAKRSEASGFCYLNDIVLAIDHLRSHPTPQFNGAAPQTSSGDHRVLYVDFDLHHADGVEQAFWYSSRVVTFSVHHASPGFFPGTGTGTLPDPRSPNPEQTPLASWHFPNGAGRGQFGAFNLPLAEGADDLTWSQAVLPVLDMLHVVVQPTYVVVQCGADCLSTDPHAVFNLTNLSRTESAAEEEKEEDCRIPVEEGRPVRMFSGYLEACKRILTWGLPTLFVGGGGYNFPDTARLWTRLTALVVEQVEHISLNISSEIPDHCFLHRYGPDFELDISSVPRTNRTQPRDIQQQHKRLFQQACDYADLNDLQFDRELYRERLCKADDDANDKC